MQRGYAVVALDNPKYGGNVGAVLRAAFVYNTSLIVISGTRFKHERSDVPKTWRHVPVVLAPNILDLVPYDCIPVAVDLIEGATPLPVYEHPERAFYIFGAEDATLDKNITSHCRDVVMVPTRRCMNLAAAVNVVLYDRMVKRQLWTRGDTYDTH